MTWPQIAALDREVVVLVPIAAVEQHGHHLPMATDTILCDAVVFGVENLKPEKILLLPTQWLGASTHHLGMPGTLSATWSSHINIILEPIRCLLEHGFKRILIVNGHGGNADGFHLALRQLALEKPHVFLGGINYWDAAADQVRDLLRGPRKSVGHACEFETALMMHLRPELVATAEIKDDDVGPELLALRNVFFPLDMKHQTKYGCAGNPTAAMAETGRRLYEAVIAGLAKTIEDIRALPLKADRPKSFND